jgi:FkbH-like protein
MIMDRVPMDVLLIADHHTANLASILRKEAEGLFTVSTAPLDQVQRTLHEAPSADRIALVWTRPERVSQAFQQVHALGNATWTEVLAEVDAFVDAILEAAPRFRSVHLPLWTIDPAEHHGPDELDPSRGAHGLLLRMNARLAERLEGQRNVHLMNSLRWLHAAGPQAFAPKLWYMTKTLFSAAVYQLAARELITHHRLRHGDAIKLIVLDLDDTLWGGIVGDDGWQDLRLGGHDALGESFVDFQRQLKALKERGVLLALASKNDEAVALEAIDKHPEMVLRRSDLVTWRINWNDKAGNIADMLRELNLGARHTLFLDDNPVERERVRSFLPEVQVPELPANKLLYPSFLRALPILGENVQSDEDRARTALYVAERERSEARLQTGDVNGWLRSLDMRVVAQPVNDADLPRVHQLFNKTNQFNLTTRRPSYEELLAFRDTPDHALWCFRVSDRFGDAGLTGILGMHLRSDQGPVVTDLILSCRVMGRMVEETLLHVAQRLARESGDPRLHLHYLPTPKNRPILEFLERSVLSAAGEGRFVWPGDRDIPAPDTLTLELIR